MHEFIRPVGGAIALLALMGVRCLGPHNMFGLEGLVEIRVRSAVFADVPSVFTSHPVAAFSAMPLRDDHAAT